jgi:hypothetical protein
MPLVVGREIHFADHLDSAFSDEYSDPVWINEHLLCFRSQAYVAGDEDNLVIRNESSKQIKFLRVRTYDMFLVFNLEPGESESMSTLPWAPRCDFAEVGTDGRWVDDSELREEFVHVDLPRNKAARYRYVVIVKDGDSRTMNFESGNSTALSNYGLDPTVLRVTSLATSGKRGTAWPSGYRWR